MHWSQETAEQKLAALKMEDMPIICIAPEKVKLSPDWFTRYKNLCRQFMESLTDSTEEMAFMNLSQDEFMGLITGKRMPANLSIRFRIPLVFGGGLELDNMFMCSTFPHSHRLDRFIIEQYGNEKIWLPNPVKKIYVPAHTASGGDGGNATADRLSQLAAQLAAERGIE